MADGDKKAKDGENSQFLDQSSQPSARHWLGGYLTVVAVALVFFVYVLWPEIELGGENGKIEWSNAVRAFDSVEIGAEPRLILLVVLGGALGSYVHAATSFVTFVGNRALVASWTWWYLLRPFIGMAIALVFYFVVRGGLLSVGATAGDVSPFGITAIAALVGMFSKQATDKLREVFDNLFRTKAGGGDDQRRDKLTRPVSVTDTMIPLHKITALNLAAGQTERDVKILDLYNEYGGVVTRLPVLDAKGVVRHVIHQSVVFRFISAHSVEGLRSKTETDLRELTLEDLLAFPETGKLVSTAIAFVSRDAIVEEARAAMEEVPKCQDVFVTVHGEKHEPILGWLTNVDIGRLAGG